MPSPLPHALLALATLALLLAAPLASAFATPNTPAVLVIAPGGCAAFEYSGLLSAGGGGMRVGLGGGKGIRGSSRTHPFSYEASLLAVDAPDSCVGSVNISRLYMQDACIALRDNELRLQSYKDLTCAATTDGGPRTCAAVQQNAPAGTAVNVGALLDAATTLAQSAAASAAPADGEYAEAPPALPTVFDTGSVCANQDTGYLYVRNGCIHPVRLSVRLSTSTYKGKHACVGVAGRQLSGLALAIVIIGSLAAFGVAGSLMWCCVRWCVSGGGDGRAPAFGAGRVARF